MAEGFAEGGVGMDDGGQVAGGAAAIEGQRGFADQVAGAGAFEGMQPSSKQTPPNRGRCSTSVTDIPKSAAKKAAAYPPGPPPMTTSSQ